MKIITKQIEKLIEKYPLYSQEGNMNAKVLFKVFNPYGRGSWYITEANKTPDGDYECFGLVDIFDCEMGYFMLSDLINARVNVFGAKLPLERDRYFEGKTLEDAYRDCGHTELYQSLLKTA